MTLTGLVLSYAAYCGIACGAFVVCYAAWLKKEKVR